jgi:hypothetical protein
MIIEGKGLLVGDEIADALTEYAAMVARIHQGDRVKIKALSAVGELTEVTVVFTNATAMVAETVHSELPEPENQEAIDYLRQQSMAISNIPGALADALDERSRAQELDQLQTEISLIEGA